MLFPKVRWMQLKFAGSGLILVTFLTVAVGQEKANNQATNPDSKKPILAETEEPVSKTKADGDPAATDPFGEGQAKGSDRPTTGGDDPFGGGSGGDSFGGGRGLGGFGGGSFGGGFGGMAGTNTRLIQGTELMISWSKNNDQLRGFSVTTGHWTPLNIKKQKIIVPVVGDGVAAVRVGSSMAAYSPKTGTWDVLKLSKESKAVPVVHTRLVTVNDNGFLYTFSADSARWTSPDDPRMQRPGPSVGGPGPGVRSQSPKPLDPEAISIVSEYRDGKLTKGVAIAAVRRAVFEEFDRRQTAQTRQAAKLRKKLEQLEAAIKQRERNRKMIVDRRVQQLLNPAGSNSQTTPVPAKGRSISR